MKKMYYCHECKHYHRKSSGVGRAHTLISRIAGVFATILTRGKALIMPKVAPMTAKDLTREV